MSNPAEQHPYYIPASNWSKFHRRSGLLCLPAIALPLILGVATGHERVAVSITAGAFSVGFGSFRKLRGSRVKPMLLATAGMCISSWAGAMAGNSFIATVCVAAAAAFAYGMISHYEIRASWVALQALIWLVVSTGFPASGVAALGRGASVLAGGLLQTGLVMLLWRITGLRTAEEGGTPEPDKQILKREPVRFAIRAAVTLAIGTSFSRWIPEQNHYWIPMTAAIVLRPAFQQTVQRGLTRIGGTIVGVLAAALLVYVAHGDPWIRAAGIVALTWGCYALFWVNYLYFAICLTSYVVLLLSFTGLQEEGVMVRRLLFTMLGGGLAFAIHWIAVHIWPPPAETAPGAADSNR